MPGALPIADASVFDRATRRATRSADLDCTPDELFDVFEDADAWPLWLRIIDRVEWHGPMPPQAGTTRTVHAVGGLPTDELFTAYERGSHMQFVFTTGPTSVLAGFGEDYRVEPRPAGGCRLTWSMVAVPAEGPGGVLTAPLGPALGLALSIGLKDLGRYVRTRLVPEG